MKKIKNLELKAKVEIVSDEGTYQGIVKKVLDETLIIVEMITEFTSNRAHKHIWKKGELKSVLVKRLEDIRIL